MHNLLGPLNFLKGESHIYVMQLDHQHQITMTGTNYSAIWEKPVSLGKALPAKGCCRWWFGECKAHSMVLASHKPLMESRCIGHFQRPVSEQLNVPSYSGRKIYWQLLSQNVSLWKGLCNVPSKYCSRVNFACR